MNRVRTVILHVSHPQLAGDKTSKIVMASPNVVKSEAVYTEEFFNVFESPI